MAASTIDIWHHNGSFGDGHSTSQRQLRRSTFDITTAASTIDIRHHNGNFNDRHSTSPPQRQTGRSTFDITATTVASTIDILQHRPLNRSWDHPYIHRIRTTICDIKRRLRLSFGIFSILSHLFDDEIFTKCTSLHMTYIQGLCNPQYGL